MKGSCIIDGVDMDDFGMFILKGGDYDFLPFPERKAPEQNNWPELDGVDVDLSEIFFKEKSVTVRFYIKAETSDEFIYRLNSFYKRISMPGYRQLYSREFDRTFWLRYVSCPDYTHRGGLFKTGAKRGTLSVNFSMDDPLQLFTDRSILIPTVEGRTPTQVSINGYDLSRFGIVVNQCYNSVLKLSAAKQPLSRSFERMTGLLVSEPEQAAFEAKQITIECTMLADDRTEFYHNYEALFNNLTLPRPIQVSTLWSDSDCFYTSMSDFSKFKAFKNGIHISFNLNLTCITAGLIEFLLSTENGYLVTTENDFFIEM